jgi:pyruvate-formate lyase-activating enzyme
MNTYKEKPVAIYGTGAVALTFFKELTSKYNIVCFIDSNEQKQGLTLYDFPIYSFDMANGLFDDLHIFVAVSDIYKFEIIDGLVQKSVNPEKILNYEPYKKYKSCTFLESRLSINDKNIIFCCGGYKMHNSPVVTHTGNPVEIVDNVLKKRDYVISVISQDNPNPETYPDVPCINCPQIKEQFWSENRKFKDISFTIYAPCNFDCIYCVEHANILRDDAATVEQCIDVFKEVEKRNLISSDVRVAPVPTEISIYPKKDLIFDTFEKYNCGWVSNASVFSERLAKSLSKGGKITASLDAGTPETFLKIKNIKNKSIFENVCLNLEKYSDYGCVVLKYVLLQEININKQDFNGFIQICKRIKNLNVQIARDYEDCRDNYSDEKFFIRTSETSVSKKSSVIFTEKELGLIAQLYNELIKNKISTIIIWELFSEYETTTLTKLIKSGEMLDIAI